MNNKFIIVSIIVVILLSIPAITAVNVNIDGDNKEIEKEDDLEGWNLGFILCRVCYMETWSWYIQGMPGERIECIDLDSGEIVSQGKTWIFGFFLFKFLPLGHDYKIITYNEYGQMSKKIYDLDFFQKVELLFIIGY